jgi:hypothetical protein
MECALYHGSRAMNLNAALLQPKRIVVQVSRGLPGPKGQVDASDVNDAVLAWLAANDVLAVSRTAGETLSALRCVWEDNSGKVWLLDADDTAHAALFAGVTTTAGQSGAQVTVQRAGVLDAGGLNLTPGPVWLGTNGALTQTPPTGGCDLYIGAAVAGSRLILSPAEPIYSE